MASATAGAQKAVAEEAETIKNEVASFLEQVYPKDVERKTLMQGYISEGIGNVFGQFGKVGTHEGGRLQGWTPLPQIIRDCAVRTQSEAVTSLLGASSAGGLSPRSAWISGGSWVTAQACSTDEINKKARFSYGRKKQSGPFFANPFHGKYVQSVEEGGTWTVRPRADNRGNVLYPQPGILAKEMIKQIAPHHMFENTIRKMRAQSKIRVMRKIKMYVASVAGKSFGIYQQTLKAQAGRVSGSQATI